MKQLRNIVGYVLGGMMFVVLLPTIMWLASGMPALEHIGALRASLTGLLMVGGLSIACIPDRTVDGGRLNTQRVDYCLYEASRQRQSNGRFRT